MQFAQGKGKTVAQPIPEFDTTPASLGIVAANDFTLGYIVLFCP